MATSDKCGNVHVAMDPSSGPCDLHTGTYFNCQFAFSLGQGLEHKQMYWIRTNSFECSNLQTSLPI